MLISKFVSDGAWHHLAWTRRFKHITLTLDKTSTAQADLPGGDSEFNTAQEPVVHVDIAGFPAGVSQVKGKVVPAGNVLIKTILARCWYISVSFSVNIVQ